MPDLSPPVWIALAAILGLLVGSFLNVVILRLPKRMEAEWQREARSVLELEAAEEALPPGIVREPSHCPQCKHPLSAADNIPLLGWLLLRGRCRYCKARISIQYPLVELLSGVLSAIVVWKFGPTWPALAGLLFTWALIALAGIDFRTQFLPDQITLPLMWLGLLLALIPMFVSAPSAILGGAIGYMSLWGLYWGFRLLFAKEGLGYGDFKLFAAFGAWMGPLSLIGIAFLSAFVGLLISIPVLMIQRKKVFNTQIPFGVYLAPAGWIWFIAGHEIVQAYLRSYGLQ